jgi:acyl-homoserine lactone acylase PvdQ
MKKLAFLLLVVFTACGPNAYDVEVARWDTHAANVEIIRDDFGVPHIYGESDADAVLGCFMPSVKTISQELSVTIIGPLVG